MPQGTEVISPTFPTQLPTLPSTASNEAVDPEIQNILKEVPQATLPTAAPYIKGSDANPYLKAPNIKPMVDNNTRPLSQTSGDIKLARQKNAFASVQNMVRSYTNKENQDKFEKLKTEIGTIMNAQKQIDNANAVLAEDPNNAMAKAVIEQNKKIIDAKFSDKSISKSLQKAFDISFTDPEQNNTPEVKAAQAAAKEHQQAVHSGTDVNNPQEKQIAAMAANGGKPPAQVTAQNTTQSAASPKQSNTPFADQFLKSTTSSIAPNPMYGAQLKAYQDQQKAITEYVIPKILDTYSKKYLEEIRQTGLNNRLEWKGAIEYQSHINKLLNDQAIQNSRNKTQITKQAMANYSAMQRLIFKTNAAAMAWDAPGIKGTMLANKLKEQAMAEFDKSTNAAISALSQLTTAEQANHDAKGEVKDPNMEEALKSAIDMQNFHLGQMQDQRQKFVTQIFGTATADKNSKIINSTTQGYINVTGSGSANATSGNNNIPAAQSGKSTTDDDSDTDPEDTTEDSAEDKAIDNFNITDQ